MKLIRGGVCSLLLLLTSVNGVAANGGLPVVVALIGASLCLIFSALCALVLGVRALRQRNALQKLKAEYEAKKNKPTTGIYSSSTVTKTQHPRRMSLADLRRKMREENAMKPRPTSDATDDATKAIAKPEDKKKPAAEKNEKPSSSQTVPTDERSSAMKRTEEMAEDKTMEEEQGDDTLVINEVA